MKNFYVLILVAFALAACKKNNISVDKTQLNIAGVNGSTAEFTITTNTPWTLSVSDKWIQLSQASGRGDATITVTCRENIENAERHGIITLWEDNRNIYITITVVQSTYGFPALNVYFGTSSGFYYSNNGGRSWTSQGVYGKSVMSLEKTPLGIFAGTSGGLYYTADNVLWQYVRFADTIVTSLDYHNNMFFAATNYGLFKSVNGGTQWQPTTITDHLNTVSVYNTKVVAGGNSVFYRSDDGGANWSGPLLNKYNISGGISNAALYSGTLGGLYKSTDNGCGWTHLSVSGECTAIIVSPGDSVYLGTLIPFSANSGFRKSYDGGATWGDLKLNGYNVISLAKKGSYLYAGTSSYGLFISDNDGESWSKTNVQNLDIYSILVTD